MGLAMRKRVLIGMFALLSACGGSGSSSSNGSNGEAPVTPKLGFSSSDSTVPQNQSVLLSWTGEAVGNCRASGAWSGPKDSSGSETLVLSELGQQLFGLTCDVEDKSRTITKSLTVFVVPDDSPSSGVDGDDADALFEHFNQYAQ